MGKTRSAPLVRAIGGERVHRDGENVMPGNIRVLGKIRQEDGE